MLLIFVCVSLTSTQEAMEDNTQVSNGISKNSHLPGKSQQYKTTVESTAEITTPSGFTSTVEVCLKNISKNGVFHDYSSIKKKKSKTNYNYNFIHFTGFCQG